MNILKVSGADLGGGGLSVHNLLMVHLCMYVYFIYYPSMFTLSMANQYNSTYKPSMYVRFNDGPSMYVRFNDGPSMYN